MYFHVILHIKYLDLNNQEIVYIESVFFYNDNGLDGTSGCHGI